MTDQILKCGDQESVSPSSHDMKTSLMRENRPVFKQLYIYFCIQTGNDLMVPGGRSTTTQGVWLAHGAALLAVAVGQEQYIRALIMGSSKCSQSRSMIIFPCSSKSD